MYICPLFCYCRACVTCELGLQLAAEVLQLQVQQGVDVPGLPILVPNQAQTTNKK